LAEVAGALGMDVPFFLRGGRALATGRGERVRRLGEGGGYALVLVNPNLPLSTREVYGLVTERAFSGGARTRAMMQALARRSVARASWSCWSVRTVAGPAIRLRG